MWKVRERFGELALKLSETGREKEIIEAASNRKLRQALYREFGLDLSNSKQIKMSAGECQSFACQKILFMFY